MSGWTSTAEDCDCSTLNGTWLIPFFVGGSGCQWLGIFEDFAVLMTAGSDGDGPGAMSLVITICGGTFEYRIGGDLTGCCSERILTKFSETSVCGFGSDIPETITITPESECPFCCPQFCVGVPLSTTFRLTITFASNPEVPPLDLTGPSFIDLVWDYSTRTWHASGTYTFTDPVTGYELAWTNFRVFCNLEGEGLQFLVLEYDITCSDPGGIGTDITDVFFQEGEITSCNPFAASTTYPIVFDPDLFGCECFCARPDLFGDTSVLVTLDGV